MYHTIIHWSNFDNFLSANRMLHPPTVPRHTNNVIQNTKDTERDYNTVAHIMTNIVCCIIISYFDIKLLKREKSYETVD